MGTSETPAVEQELFTIIGSFGLWQKLVFVVVFYIKAVEIFPNFAMTFLAPNMDFWCTEPSTNYSWTPYSTKLPLIDKKDQCFVPISNYSSTATVTSIELHPNETVKCTKWKYDTSYFSDTIVSEWDLVCDREWLISLGKSIYMVGYLLSVVMLGQLSDWIGRFPTLVISYLITTVSVLLSLFSTSYWMFTILRFFLAFGETGLTTAGYVLIMEIVGPDYRTSVGITVQMGMSVGQIILPGIAYAFPNWFWFLVAISAPIVALALPYKYIPESPRWLLVQKKYEKLEKVLITAATMNKKELKSDIKGFINRTMPSENGGRTRKTIIDLFKSPNIRCRAIIMIYIWIVNTFLYYGISYNTNDLAGNPYLNYCLTGILEAPACIIAFLGIRRFGRRPVLAWIMVIAGTACAISIFVPENLPWLTTTFALFGYFCISGSFSIINFYTIELFPTVIRNVAIGTCSMFARTGSIAASFVREIGKATHPSVPNILYFVLAVSSGLSALLLPETKGCKIPDSLEEGENFDECHKTKLPVEGELKIVGEKCHSIGANISYPTIERDI